MSSFLTREYKFEKNSKISQKQFNKMPEKRDPHTLALRSLQKLVKPLLRLIKKKQILRKTLAEIQEQNANNSSLEDMRKDPAALSANDDNLANEALEQRLFNEIHKCPENMAAMTILQDGNDAKILPIQQQPQQQQQPQFIPVHFVRTSSGTFFWTSMDVTRQQELLLRAKFDRWGQA